MITIFIRLNVIVLSNPIESVEYVLWDKILYKDKKRLFVCVSAFINSEQKFYVCKM